MKKIKALAIFNALSFIIHLSATYLIQSGALGLSTVGEISDKYPSLFTPAGMTFSIWGVIYTLLGMMCLYHIVIAYKHDMDHPSNSDLVKMGSLFIFVNLASAAWLWVWVNELIFGAVLLIFFQLLCLIIIHKRLSIYDPLKSPGMKLSTHVPLSIYLGWISIAAIANTASFLAPTGLDGFGITPVQWTIILISVAVILALIMILAYRNIYFGLIVAWGLYGIFIKRDEENPEGYKLIIMSAIVGIGILLLCCLVQLIRNLSARRPTPIFPSAPIPVK